mmetsp:Transcript_33103/g.108754  ORF Transcript_33103/g.108754 Transcript_33103/m.108754 type:complete len:279 (-) Transcript_33103:107-943(-)
MATATARPAGAAPNSGSTTPHDLHRQHRPQLHRGGQGQGLPRRSRRPVGGGREGLLDADGAHLLREPGLSAEGADHRDGAVGAVLRSLPWHGTQHDLHEADDPEARGGGVPAGRACLHDGGEDFPHRHPASRRLQDRYRVGQLHGRRCLHHAPLLEHPGDLGPDGRAGQGPAGGRAGFRPLPLRVLRRLLSVRLRAPLRRGCLPGQGIPHQPRGGERPAVGPVGCHQQHRLVLRGHQRLHRRGQGRLLHLQQRDRPRQHLQRACGVPRAVLPEGEDPR